VDVEKIYERKRGKKKDEVENRNFSSFILHPSYFLKE